MTLLSTEFDYNWLNTTWINSFISRNNSCNPFWRFLEPITSGDIHLFWQCARGLKIQINNDFPTWQQNISIYTQDTLHYYLNYYVAHPLSKLVKMWQKVDFSETLCDGQQKLFVEMMKRCQLSCVKMLCFDGLL